MELTLMAKRFSFFTFLTEISTPRLIIPLSMKTANEEASLRE